MIDHLAKSFFFVSNRQNQECRQKFEVTWLQQLDGTNSTTVWPLQVPYWWEQLVVWYLRPKYLRNPPCFLQVYKLTFIFLSTGKCSMYSAVIWRIFLFHRGHWETMETTLRSRKRRAIKCNNWSGISSCSKFKTIFHIRHYKFKIISISGKNI